MATVDPLRQRINALFHFTDTRNLPTIKQYGGLYSRAKLKEMGVKIPYPGGNDWSHEADDRFGMDRYVHLCFKPNHPMEHLAKQDGRIEASIFLNIDPEVLFGEGVRFSPGVSNKSDMSIYSIDEARDLIDYQVLYTYMDWNDPEIQQRLQNAEKCEILVPDHIPMTLIRNFPND